MRPGGGTGRHDGFKHRCLNGREGSTPSRAIKVKFNPFGKPIKKIYGPYVHESVKGSPRRRILIKFKDGSDTTMAYARWKMIQSLCRVLDDSETVDHCNENSLDDRLSNLQILSRIENNRKSAVGRPSPFRGIEKGFTHGTYYAWMRKKCKCKKCLESKRKWYDKRNEKRRKPGGYGRRRGT